MSADQQINQIHALVVKLNTVEKGEQALSRTVEGIKHRTTLGADAQHPVYFSRVDSASFWDRALGDPVAIGTFILALVTLTLAVIPLYIRKRDIDDAKAATRTQVIGILKVFQLGVQGFVVQPRLAISAVNGSWTALIAELLRHEVASALRDNTILAELYQLLAAIQTHIELVSDVQTRINLVSSQLADVRFQSLPETNPDKIRLINEVSAREDAIKTSSHNLAGRIETLAKKLA